MYRYDLMDDTRSFALLGSGFEKGHIHLGKLRNPRQHIAKTDRDRVPVDPGGGGTPGEDQIPYLEE